MKVITSLDVPFGPCENLPIESKMDCFIQAARNYLQSELAHFLGVPEGQPFIVRGAKFLLLCTDASVRPTLYVTVSTVQRNPSLAEMAAAKSQGNLVIPAKSG